MPTEPLVKGNPLKTSLLIFLSIVFLGSAYAGDPKGETWEGVLVIDWGDGDTAPRIALLDGRKITDKMLSRAVLLKAEKFTWNGEPVPGVWVFYPPDQMKQKYFTVALLTPVKLAGAGSTIHRTKDAVMMAKIERTPRSRGKRRTIVNANGVVGYVYEVSLDKLKCFGEVPDCKQLELDVEAAAKKVGE